MSSVSSETLQLGHDDAAFILGKNGRTKEKIARVAECALDLNDSERLEIRGNDRARRRAKKSTSSAS